VSDKPSEHTEPDLPAALSDEGVSDLPATEDAGEGLALPDAPREPELIEVEGRTQDVTPITRVLDGIGVRTIIVVDDDVPDVEAIKSRIQQLERIPACVADLSEKPWPAGRADRVEFIRSIVDSLSFLERRTRTEAFYKELGLPHDWWSAISGSLADIDEIGEIAVLPVHPREWEVHMPSFPLTAVPPAEPHRIPVTRELLVLFDNNLSNYRPAWKDGGLRLARELATAAGDSVLCGIISRAIQSGREYETAWTSLEPDERDRLVLIAKDTIDESPSDFAYRVARVALANEVVELRTQALAAIGSANAEAVLALGKLDIDALIHAVVRRPPEEGVGEFDTLIRLYSIHFTDAIARAGPNEDTLQRIVRNLRSKLPVGGSSVPHKLREIRRREWLVDGPTINRRFAPVASGDIFEIRKPSEESARKFVLVMQPCDIQIRRTGRRDIQSAGAETMIGTLLPVRAHDATSTAPGFVIDYAELTATSVKNWIVLFRPVLYVPFDVLDLCAYSASGRARLTAPDVQPAEATLPAPLPASLEARFRLLYARVRLIISAANEPVDGATLSSRPGVVTDVKGSIQGDTLSYECNRLGRLQPLVAAELLNAFTQFAGRVAREMDFARNTESD